jgi:hypothetical protein
VDDQPAEPETLSRIERLVAAALVKHRTAKAAAEDLGISERWVRAIRKRPHVQAEIDYACQRIFDQAIRELQRDTLKSVRRLAKAVGNPDDTIATRAAVAQLNQVHKLAMTEESGGGVRLEVAEELVDLNNLADAALDGRIAELQDKLGITAGKPAAPPRP